MAGGGEKWDVAVFPMLSSLMKGGKEIWMRIFGENEAFCRVLRENEILVLGCGSTMAMRKGQ